MITRLIPILGFLLVLGYVAILVIEVPRLDLAMVIGATMLLALYDLYKILRETSDRD